MPLEQEIRRLEMEVDNLKNEKARLEEAMFRRGFEVKKLEARVSADREKLAETEKSIRAMRQSLASKDEYVTYLDRRFERGVLQDDLRRVAANFRLDEQTLKSREEQLGLKKQDYDAYRKMRAELELARQEMLTELERMRTDLAKERQVQASENKTIATPGFEKVRKDMDRVRDRVEELKMRRELKGDVDGPVRSHERRKKELDEIDRYLDTRFGDKQ